MLVSTLVKGYLPVPPPEGVPYAPMDLALDLCDGLVARGHIVDFYAPIGSRLRDERVRLVTMGQKALAYTRDEYVDRESGILFNPAYASDNVLALRDEKYSRDMFRRANRGELDVLHFHHPEVAFPYAELFPGVPVVSTIHDPIEGTLLGLLRDNATPNHFYTPISNYQRDMAPGLNFTDTVYDGIDTEKFKPGDESERGDRLLFVGRIIPEKGVKEAIEIAVASDSRLDIIGPTFDDDGGYYKEYVKPHLDGDRIRHLGHIARNELPAHYRRAKALLAPIQWHEPFGLYLAEANACGTPVITYERGSAPEVVAHEETGFVVDPDDMEGMIQAVRNVSEISHDASRRRALGHFSIATMVTGYENVYQAAIGKVRG
jgi:glycosyltransferase involved in cell wall biosynthesis